MKDLGKENQKVLVTGGTGFIGSHLVEELVKRNYQVICLVQPNDDMYWIKSLDIQTVVGDITKKESLYESVKGCSIIFHLAALLGSRDPEKLYRINYIGTKNLIDVCVEMKMNLDRLLFVSSVAAMGPTDAS